MPSATYISSGILHPFDRLSQSRKKPMTCKASFSEPLCLFSLKSCCSHSRIPVSNVQLRAVLLHLCCETGTVRLETLLVQVSAEMYSAPSIVLQSRGADGSVHVFDDFRESYAWLRQNTAEDAKASLLHFSRSSSIVFLPLRIAIHQVIY